MDQALARPLAVAYSRGLRLRSSLPASAGSPEIRLNQTHHRTHSRMNVSRRAAPAASHPCSGPLSHTGRQDGRQALTPACP